MDLTVYPGLLKGSIAAIPSKSQAHRLLICAAFAQEPTLLRCDRTNRDMEATAACLESLGAHITRSQEGYLVKPMGILPETAELACGESGSTLRFLLPVVGALGIDATFRMEGRLPQRPLSPLWEEMERMGCKLSRPTADTLRCCGRLRAGEYRVAGNVSSQFITGLLLAGALMEGTTRIRVVGKLESKPYVDMTLEVLRRFGVRENSLEVEGSYPLTSPKEVQVEGDWSNAAFFLAARELGSNIAVTGLEPASPQGDRAAVEILARQDGPWDIDASDIPDLVPILSVAAAAQQGAIFRNVARLRLKESDRVASVCAMLNSLGIHTQARQDTLVVFPGKLTGGIVDACGDHRIAMSAAIAATVAQGPVRILGAACVSKSYPDFWEEFNRLGGKYEQYLR